MSEPKECKISEGPLDWIGCYFDNWFTELVQFFQELPIKLLRLFLDAIVAIVDTIPKPSFLGSSNINDFIDPSIMYFLSMSGIATALSIIGGAYLFFFLRRILTLGVW